ncbi:SH3 domain-containing protein [Propionibacteriaceae bacterium Y1700]|uniref:SH3 domain-containing protein n=1 Tax=Microlunatus sp. Y1700 TaxID=3418487 RepID=UPI003DA78E0A
MVLPSSPQSVKAEPAAVSQADLAQRQERADRSAARQARVDELAKKAADADAKRADEARKADDKNKKEKKGSSTLAEAKPEAIGVRYATTNLNLRTEASAEAKVADVLEEGAKVEITGGAQGEFAQVIVDGTAYWVSAQYLSKDKPEPEPTEGSGSDKAAGSEGSDSSGSDDSDSGSSSGGSADSSAPCPSGSSVESGLTPNAIKVHRSVCHKFPQVTSYGGVRADALPEHPSGRALDCMISSNATGWEIARYVRANASSLGVTQVIFDQHIWTTQRSGEGWRQMEDRGGATANHQDHVHVTVA